MQQIGFNPDEIITSQPTRAARLKWVILVLDDAPAGLQANAVACVSAATSAGVTGLLGRGGTDATGRLHAGLPWAGCSLLSASAERLAEILDRASSHDDIFVADMPTSAQTNRVYDEYLSELLATTPADVLPLAISIVGPRNAVDRLVKRLPLL